jgi:hypothetical protein
MRIVNDGLTFEDRNTAREIAGVLHDICQGSSEVFSAIENHEGAACSVLISMIGLVGCARSVEILFEKPIVVDHLDALRPAHMSILNGNRVNYR